MDGWTLCDSGDNGSECAAVDDGMDADKAFTGYTPLNWWSQLSLTAELTMKYFLLNVGICLLTICNIVRLWLWSSSSLISRCLPLSSEYSPFRSLFLLSLFPFHSLIIQVSNQPVFVNLWRVHAVSVLQIRPSQMPYGHTINILYLLIR